MATLNRTFSVKNGIDVANTIIVDSSRNLSNIQTANATTINASTYLTVAGLNLVDHTNNAYNQANTAYSTANVANATANLAYAQANSNYQPAVTRLDVTNSGASAFRFDQYGAAVNNPTLYIRGGETLAFNLNNAGHPFVIRVSSGGANSDTGLTHVSTAGVVTTGSAAQGKVTGTLYWKVPYELIGNTYVYQCTVHGGMVGNIVIEPPMVIAYAQANAAYNQANSARDQANTARDTANGAYAQANGAYAQANGAYAQANGAYNQANGAYAQANGAYNQANGAYNQANTSANTVRVYANGAGELSNKFLNFVNSASIQVTVSSDNGNANISFNTTGAAVADAYAQANAAYSQANGAYAQANGAYAQANGAYGQANLAFAQANSAYGQANLKVASIAVSGNGLAVSNVTTANINDYTISVIVASTSLRGTTLLIDSTSSTDTGNAATANAVNAAFNFANTMLPKTGGTISGDLTVSGNLFLSQNTTLINLSLIHI